MDEVEVDVAVIGAGTAGLNARRAVEKAGKRFVLIERGAYGTTCARVGCMPSKLLIAAADAAHDVERGATFGVYAGQVRVDGAAVMERVRRERDRFTADVVELTEAIPAEHRLCGDARFVAPTTLAVGDHTRVRARAVVIATGSRPFVPPPFDALPERVDVNDDVFEWRTLPRSVAVVGTGIIALELGQALHRLGVEVAFFNPYDELGTLTDPVLDALSRALFAKELELHLGVEELSAELVDGGVRVGWSDTGRRQERTFERVLAAAGRLPNLEGLDLSNTGLPLDAGGRPPWEPSTCQCGDAPIFLAGDVSGHLPVLHEASEQGHIAGANAAAFPDVTTHVRRTRLAIAFTDPQVALVGAPFADLPDEIAVGDASFERQGRARVMGVNAGLLRLYGVRGTSRIAGAQMIGPRVEHLAHLIAWAVQQRVRVQDCLSMPFYHPVLEEALRTALRDLAGKLDVLRECRGEDFPDCPGD